MDNDKIRQRILAICERSDGATFATIKHDMRPVPESAILESLNELLASGELNEKQIDNSKNGKKHKRYYTDNEPMIAESMYPFNGKKLNEYFDIPFGIQVSRGNDKGRIYKPYEIEEIIQRRVNKRENEYGEVWSVARVNREELFRVRKAFVLDRPIMIFSDFSMSDVGI